MNIALKKIVANTYKPVLEKYLSKKRTYPYKNIRLEIPPGIFHPGFFTSTQFLLSHILTFDLKEKKLLEPGAGSGLISLIAAKKGADVYATDINPVAIEWLGINSRKNAVAIKIIHSDLFDNIPRQPFDIIAINPPYYKKEPKTLSEYGWYCGKNGEYFYKLFRQLCGYIHSDSEIMMVLCDGCDLEMIQDAAGKNGFRMNRVSTKKTILEKNFIYKIKMTA